MAFTIFFSWQSDSPKETNYSFILRALETACAEINKDYSLIKPIRIDHDTKGLPGSPSITESIFSKINDASVFVPDLTIIGKPHKKPTPNPNVLVEYGYALSRLGEERILPILNTCYGSPRQLPFDLASKRCTITYHFAPQAKIQTNEKTFRDLVNDLKTHLLLIYESLPSSENSHAEDNFTSFDEKVLFQADRQLALSYPKESPLTRNVFEWIHGPTLYIKAYPGETFDFSYSKTGQLCLEEPPLSNVFQINGWTAGRQNDDGFVNMNADPQQDGSGDFRFHVFSYTQLFRNGLICAANQRPFLSREMNFLSFNSKEIEYLSFIATRNILAFFDNKLSTTKPFKIRLGLINIKGCRFFIPEIAGTSRLMGEALQDYVHYDFAINKGESLLSDHLEPFFSKIWDNHGLAYPKK